jgi:hypothetical protein
MTAWFAFSSRVKTTLITTGCQTAFAPTVCDLQAEEEVSLITVDSSCQVSKRCNPSARAAVTQLIKKQELGLGLAALPRHVLADISQGVENLTRGSDPGGNFLSICFAKLTQMSSLSCVLTGTICAHSVYETGVRCAPITAGVKAKCMQRGVLLHQHALRGM